MKFLRVFKRFVAAIAVAGLAAAGYATRDVWQRWLVPPPSAESAAEPGESVGPVEKVILTERAQTNLGLSAKPLKPTSYWKTLAVPGTVVDRPGRSDRGVVAPATAVVESIHRVPGDAIRPGEPLFTLKLLSEALHQTQTELYKSAQDIKLTQAQRQRLVAASGAVPEARVVEVDAQLARLQVGVRAFRQELLTRGLMPDQIDGVAEGRFVTEIVVAAPKLVPPTTGDTGSLADTGPPYELQELKAELGQQVTAGQTLGTLADHRQLAIEGRAFRDEAPLIERAVQEGWPVEVDVQEPPGSAWPAGTVSLTIRSLANAIDPAARTFGFLLQLENPSRTVERDGRAVRLWRFRPGQKVRLHVPVERLDGVFVLPADAVTRDGAEWFAFTQNVNTFERKSVHVLLRDRGRVVVANDGGIVSGSFVVQSAAAQISRTLKAQTGGAPKGYHVHADGSLHKNGEPD